MTQHTMDVRVSFDVDESDIICDAASQLADRAEKGAWYHKIRDAVDALSLEEVRERVSARVDLAIERGVSKGGTGHARTWAKRPGLQNAQSGAGGDWYETMTFDEFVEMLLHEEINRQVGVLASAAAKRIADAGVQA